MATSSSDESCSAPTEFDVSLDGSNGKFSSTYERCPLCTKCKRVYYCKDCIRKGEFVYSIYPRYPPESFAEKKLRLFDVTKDRLLLLDRVNVCIRHKLRMEELKTKIETCQKNIVLLKLVVADTRDAVKNIKSDMVLLTEDIRTQNYSLPRKVKSNSRMEQHKNDCMRRFCNQMTKLEHCRSRLKEETRKNAALLVEHIFPIIRVYPEDSQEDCANGETINALAEASRTAYIKGRWVYMDNSGDLQYRIVEPLLPGSGDYSAYNVRVASNKESFPAVASEFGHRNSGSAIGAALTYTCQFVSVLAFYMDIWLPKRLCYSEFCSHELSEQDFACKVAKLNANVLHLCLSQSIDPEILHPKWTAANLLLLLDPKVCDLGRYGPVELSVEVMKSMEESLMQDISSTGDSDQIDDDALDDFDSFSEWETITEVMAQPPRVTSSAMPYAHQYHLPGTFAGTAQAPPQDGATSMAGGLAMSAAASLVSLWRGAFGAK